MLSNVTKDNEKQREDHLNNFQVFKFVDRKNE